MRGHQEQVPRALWWKRDMEDESKEIGRAGVYWCPCWSLCLLDVLASDSNKSMCWDRELIWYPSLPQMRKTPPWPPPDLVRGRRGGGGGVTGWLLWWFTTSRLHNISTPRRYYIVKEKVEQTNLLRFIPFNEKPELMGEFNPVWNSHKAIFMFLCSVGFQWL